MIPQAFEVERGDIILVEFGYEYRKATVINVAWPDKVHVEWEVDLWFIKFKRNEWIDTYRVAGILSGGHIKALKEIDELKGLMK